MGLKKVGGCRGSRVVCMSGLLALLLLLGSGCGSSIMIKATPISQPSEGKALVTFVRPSVVGGAISFGIWDSDKLVGVLGAGQSIYYETTPGEHYFLARAENWSCVKADLAANKQYVIKANPVFGVMKARVAFDPVKAVDYPKQQKDVQKWLTKLTPMAPDPEKAPAYVEARRADVMTSKNNFAAGKGRYETLAAGDALP